MLLKDAQQQDQRATLQEMQFSVNYLTAFGYLAKFAWDNRDEIIAAVKAFQKWFNEKQDGIVGPRTLKAMQLPRCGCPDVLSHDADHVEYMAMRRIVSEKQVKWGKDGLKFYIKSYVSGLTRQVQKQIYAGAWDAWNKVCGIKVRRTKKMSDADLIIDTGEGYRSQFDGPGGTLAWAYLPTGNDEQLLMRFDLGERWIANPSQRGILLFNVACHEFGHMLGLDHSHKSGALMAPYYNPTVDTPQWDDDIPRVQALYGRPVAQVKQPAHETYTLHCTNLVVEGHKLECQH
jgi:hypothetical protein